MNQKFKGTSISEGFAFGKPLTYTKNWLNTKLKFKDKKKSIKIFNLAIEKTIKQIQNDIVKLKNKLSPKEIEIFKTHILMINDPNIKEKIISSINACKKEIDLIEIINKTFNELIIKFKQIKNDYIKNKIADFNDIKERIITNILKPNNIKKNILNKDVIFVCNELTPSISINIVNNKHIKGVIAEFGSNTSHAAILIKNLGIPCIFGIQNITKSTNIKNIFMNGYTGEIEINLDNKTIFKLLKHNKELKEQEEKYAFAETKTIDGKSINIEININSEKDLLNIKNVKFDGVGLCRSEFLYIESNNWPSEDYQFQYYKKVLQCMRNKLVVIRTLDIGGDKKLPYFHFDNEENPFLGFRAIRFLLKNKKIFRTQLRALGRASVYGKLAIMFPMIANISEFVESKQYTETIFNELRKENIPVAKNIQIGMMVEIPSSAIIADKFSKYSDFFSIGTNDLIQYTFAADRLNKSCNYLYQPNNPAILKLIKSTIDGAKLNNKWVGMCGEMASDIASTPLLIGLGINSLSVHPTKIKKIRQIVNNIKSSDCKKLASKALTFENCEKINNLVNSFLKERKLI